MLKIDPRVNSCSVYIKGMTAKLTNKLERDMLESYAESCPGAPEEYSEYVNNKETLPEATFQYGIKMADGRKTKETGTEKRDEKIKWSIIEREAFCVPEALKKFDTWVCGARTQICVSGGSHVIQANNPFTYLTNNTLYEAKLSRWELELPQYNLTISYRKGTQQIALSSAVWRTSRIQDSRVLWCPIDVSGPLAPPEVDTIA
ncbi:retrovirus-related Pol polyprotein from transposon 297 [Nephila pilipes]|uniref:Retrovirus-related Pol polyprotein from transposon 297 n=1 Tax=Nephila pilipes TaxID=299642 RepID=A0A8X6JXX9_NEPPI|nr:retrovirus-related Pol polyprotein from transposon 297 [Nephila pilipes]